MGLQVRLLGRFEVSAAGNHVRAFETPGKVQELLGYLLLFRGRPHRRESVADALWTDAGWPSSRKSLRQALWHLQAVLEETVGSGRPLLEVDQEWIAISPDADFYLDVQEFEDTFDGVRGRQGEELADEQAATLRQAVAVYRGDLLEGWYDDWCVFDRERLKSIYLAILDKLLGYCESRCQWDSGLVYGGHILRYDRAHERTHWRMMRLHYLAGDRTAAVRQFEECAAALHRELGIRPGELTTELYEEICADRSIAAEGREQPRRRQLHVGRMLSHMRQVKRTLAYTEHLVADDIAEIEASLDRPSGGPPSPPP
jgi:DNA-binding SARP family transcriptional activator